MRKVIFQEWLSMDGYAADAKGNVTFIESTTLNKYSDLEQLEWLDTIDTILLGANTYQLFVEYWPTATTAQEVIADKLNSIPKIVFSKSLKSAPWGKWPDADIIPANAVQALKDLKSKEGRDMVLWGSISLAQSFMKANLIDEYHFRICPVALGKGRPLFETTGQLNFELYHSKKYDSGLMLLKYHQQVKRTDSASRIIKASPEKIYQSFLNPEAIASWRPPKGMKCHIYSFNPNEGGTYHMSFEYKDTDHQAGGKTSADADVFHGSFIRLIPDKRIVELVEFESDDPVFAGMMTITTTLVPEKQGTRVTFLAENVPEGIKEDDHYQGMMSTLKNLADFTE